MQKVKSSPNIGLYIGIAMLMLFGAALMGTTVESGIAVVYIFAFLYFVAAGLQGLGFTLALGKAALNQGSGGAAARGFGAVMKIAIPVYAITIVLLLLDAAFTWRLASNPISLIIFFFSIRFFLARADNRQDATGLLRGANPTSAADGVAAQRRREAPDFSGAERPADPVAATRPLLSKAPVDLLDAERPADEV